MSDIEVSFSSVSIPTDTSVDLVVYEDTSGDGNADNQASTSMSDGTTTYTLSGFTGGAGNEYWWEVKPDNTDVAETAIVEVPVDLTIK